MEGGLKLAVKLKIVSVILIAAGLLMLFYPKLTEMAENAEQEKLAEQWQASLQNIEIRNEEPEVQGRQEAFPSIQTRPVSANATSSSEQVEGMLEIGKINLKLPILHGATKSNMRTTLASIENTGRPGEIGNYAVAGHRNRTYGRNFNRLDELAVGDLIDVDTGTEKFEYTVTEKQIVKPEDVWVLKGNGKDKEITLVTCHPMVNPTHRLIIKGKIVDKK
ncbi:class D sortase [Paenibacillus azoreducens]|uniref:Sortase n=1 Tax=Paenibacillus azoreducens TaxID=116718 RepID=A0A919YIB0_9BACL|nr:class D sortase [Paenibacillus azoreducens]GIO51274.1 sortase [Paenibacillus azoreducens]